MSTDFDIELFELLVATKCLGTVPKSESDSHWCELCRIHSMTTVVRFENMGQEEIPVHLCTDCILRVKTKNKDAVAPTLGIPHKVTQQLPQQGSILSMFAAAVSALAFSDFVLMWTYLLFAFATIPVSICTCFSVRYPR